MYGSDVAWPNPLEAGPELVDQRINHIFFRAGQEDEQVLVEDAALGGEAADGVCPSDHRAVMIFDGRAFANGTERAKPPLRPRAGHRIPAC